MKQPDDHDDGTADAFAPIGWRSHTRAATGDPRYAEHPFPLRFLDPDFERLFIAAYRRSTLSFRRLAVFIGIVAFAGFAPVDRLTNPDVWPLLWWVRFGVTLPILLATLGLGFWKKAKDYYGYAINVALLVACLSLIVMMQISSVGAFSQYFDALVLLLPVSFGFLRLRTAGATVTAVLALAAYLIEVLFFKPLPPGVLAYSIGYLLVAGAVGVVLVFLMERQARQAYVLTTILDEASLRDPLTGIHNRRWLEVSIEQLVNTYRRYGPVFSLVLIDLDGFKSVNDEFGYQAGDEVLCRVAKTVAAQIRSADTLYRYGGDEFVILCPSTTGTAAQTLVERLRKAFGELDLVQPREGGGLSFSAGTAEISDPEESLDSLFARANAALRAAKQSGKGRAVLAEPRIPASETDAGQPIG